MIHPEEFENCALYALTNNIKEIAHFSVGIGGRTRNLVKVSAVLVVPLDENGREGKLQQDAIEKMKAAKSLLELEDICRASGIVWVGGV